MSATIETIATNTAPAALEQRAMPDNYLMTMEECAAHLGIDLALIRWGVMAFPKSPYLLPCIKLDGMPVRQGSKFDFNGVRIRKGFADKWKANDCHSKADESFRAWTARKKAKKSGTSPAKASTPAHVEAIEHPSIPVAPESATTPEPCATGTNADSVDAGGLF